MAHPEVRGGRFEHGEEVCGGFFAARADAPEVFDSVELEPGPSCMRAGQKKIRINLLKFLDSAVAEQAITSWITGGDQAG